MNMLCWGKVEIRRSLSKQPFSTGSGRITLKNSPRDYFHLLKSPDFSLLVLKCAGFYCIFVESVRDFVKFARVVCRKSEKICCSSSLETGELYPEGTLI